jgi:ligand-binding sensor domain-containing protein
MNTRSKPRVRKHVLRSLALCAALVAPLALRVEALDSSRKISQYGHSVWRIQEGYLPGAPNAVAQTADGYIWVGTNLGLLRFDGVRFVPFVAPEGSHLPDTYIIALYGAKDGSLWIGTVRGLARWKNGQLTSLSDFPGRINTITEDANGIVWISRADPVDHKGPLCRVNGPTPRCYGEADGIPFNTANRMVIDPSGAIWIGGQKGLVRWTPNLITSYFGEVAKAKPILGLWGLTAQKNGDVWASVENEKGDLQLWQFSHDKWERRPLLGGHGSEPSVATVFADRDDTLWLGTARQGIFRIGNGEADHYERSDGLSSDAIAAVFQDREGTIWVASSQGVDSFRDLPVVTYSLKEGLTADSVSSVYAAHDGTVWIGNAGALDYLKDGKLSAIRTGHGLPGRDVITMTEDHTGRMWVSVDSTVAILQNGKFHEIVGRDGAPIGVVLGMVEGKQRKMWALKKFALMRIDEETGNVVQAWDLPALHVDAYSIAADPVAGVWLGATNGTLWHFLPDRTDSVPAEAAISTAKIRQLLPETDGSIWSVTEKGLVWWDGKRHFVMTAKNGLPCDEIYNAVRGENGLLWLWARCGVVAVPAAELHTWQSDPTATVRVAHYDVYDGVQAGRTSLQAQSARSPDGALWFANDSVLQTLDPNRVPRNNVPPSVIVERIVADGRVYPGEESAELPPQIRNLEIDYTGLSFVVPSKVKFRYKLEPHDKDWQDPQGRRQAFYSDLAPGKYRFRVLASNNDGVWNEEGAVADFGVSPAFFQKPWFVACVILLVMGIVWLLYLSRVRYLASAIHARMEERLRERERIARELHDTLLQSIQGLILRFHAVTKQIPRDEPAHKLMEGVLDRADQVLGEGRDRVLNLRASVEWPSDLAEAYRQVGEESVQDASSTLDVKVEGDTRTLHPMVREEVYSIGREAIVNAFRHAQDAVHVEVVIAYELRRFHLRIVDDGPGIDAAVIQSGGREGHFGLRGMRERARQISGALEVRSRVGEGTEVDLRIPANRAYQPLRTKARWIWLRRVLHSKRAADQ